MNHSDLPTRLAPLEAEVHTLRGENWDLQQRVTWLELQHGVPVACIDAVMATKMGKEREEHWREENERRERVREEFVKARDLAEMVGHRGPLDEFTRRIHAGEFDSPWWRPGV
jgi:hypothetical protein